MNSSALLLPSAVVQSRPMPVSRNEDDAAGINGGNNVGLSATVEVEVDEADCWLEVDLFRERLFIAFANVCEPDLARCEKDICLFGASPSIERGGERTGAALLLLLSPKLERRGEVVTAAAAGRLSGLVARGCCG